MSDKEKVSGEEVEVAGYRWKYQIPKELQGSEWDWSYASHWSTGPKDAEQLMTVAQHQRITEALRDEVERAWKAANSECNDWALEFEKRKAVVAERDQLRAEVERLHACYETLHEVSDRNRAERDALRAQLAQQQGVPDGLPIVIAGAIFDFAGYLTTREKVIKVGASANASPIADLVKEWALLRGLSIEQAAVLSWQECLAAAPAPVQEEVPSDGQ